MKLFIWMIPLAVWATSCSIDNPIPLETECSGKVTARIESVSDPETKVYADENLQVQWTSDDRISLFNKTTDNIQYRLKDVNEGQGVFVEVGPQNGANGTALGAVYSIYPYNEKTTVTTNGAVTLEIPAVQTYSKDTFGPGANAMVSVTEDTELLFKNLCGYLILKLYGNTVSVKSVTLEGRNHEPLAGIADVTASVNGDPSISFQEGFSTTLTLTCPDPVSIGSTKEAPTTFWFAVPPTTFTNGFTITVTDSEGNLFKKSASSASTTFKVDRNTTFRMQPLKVVPEKTYLVTNEFVQNYMQTVNYEDFDFSNSSLHGSPLPGGGPSKNDEELPPTVKIEWTQSSSTLNIDLYGDGVLERSYTRSGSKSGNSMELTNLVPGRHYTYKVYRESDGEIKGQGGFYTRGSLHQVYFQDNVRNGRDLGGWQTMDGKTVRYLKLFRGGQIGSRYMNSTGKAEMLAEGIKAEIDLREKDDVPSSSPLGSGIAFCAPGFERGYVDGMLEGNPDGVKKCFEFTVNCLRENKPVYFHCAAGRDRTGTFSIILLGLLGVREGDIAKDYELTYFSPEEWSMQKIDGEMVYNHTRDVSTYRETVEYLAAYDKSSFKTGVEKYLISIGVSQKDIDDLRTIMLE